MAVFQRCAMDAFSVIGKEGSTLDGQGFIKRLWAAANAGFAEVAPLAEKNEKGAFAGFWGAMSDLARTGAPWTDGYTQGLYLAGVQAPLDARAPEGWVKWDIPAYEYVYTRVESPQTFRDALSYLKENNLTLAGAVNDFICPQTGENYMFFPIRKQ